MSAIAGAALLALIYPIGRRLGLAPVWALLGLVLAASDFLGIVQSRIATLRRIFIALWSVLCIYLALRYVQSGHRLRWLVLCGVAGGSPWAPSGRGASPARRPWRSSSSTAVARGGARSPWRGSACATPWCPRWRSWRCPSLYVASYADYFIKGHHTLSQWWALQHVDVGFDENLHAGRDIYGKP